MNRITALSALSVTAIAALTFGAATPASAAGSWSVTDDNGVVVANIWINADTPDRVSICDPQPDGLNATVEYITDKKPDTRHPQRRVTNFPFTCAVGFAPGEKILAVNGIVGSWSTGWMKV